MTNDVIIYDEKPKLVHPDIFTEITGVELETDYKNIEGNGLEKEAIHVENFAERVAAARANINLGLDNRVESTHGTGKVERVGTIVIDNYSVMSQYSMLSLRVKYDVITSDSESSDDKSDKAFDNDTDYRPLVEDVIVGNEDTPPLNLEVGTIG